MSVQFLVLTGHSSVGTVLTGHSSVNTVLSSNRS